MEDILLPVQDMKKTDTAETSHEIGKEIVIEITIATENVTMNVVEILDEDPVEEGDIEKDL